MAEVIRVAKFIGTPGSMGFLVVCCVLGVAIAYVGPRARRLARAWLVLVFAGYVIAALPIVSQTAVDGLPGYSPVWTRSDALTDADIVIVLSGDNPRGRAQETRRLLDAGSPRCVLVSGSPWFVRMVSAAGVAHARLVVDGTANTTREQIARLSIWARQCGAQRVMLIASTVSMPRVAALVRTAGVPVVLVPSPIDEPPAAHGIRIAVPSLRALRITRDAIYEHLALRYYRRRHWIR
jgi:uncharacterized SAM-binding protein YcdF (DUF218 family)